ncbi:hypothetical protein D3C85_1015990 [compost metagenome]
MLHGDDPLTAQLFGYILIVCSRLAVRRLLVFVISRDDLTGRYQEPARLTGLFVEPFRRLRRDSLLFAFFVAQSRVATVVRDVVDVPLKAVLTVVVSGDKHNVIDDVVGDICR